MKKYKILLVLMVFVVSVSQAIAVAKEKKNIVFTFSNWVPMVYMDGFGRGQGVLVDIAREVFEKELGLNLICIERPWKRAQLQVEKGDSDFIITVATASRKKYALAGKHVFYTLPLYIYTYAGHEKLGAIHKIQSVRDIKELRLKPVTNLGNGWHKDNVDAYGINTHYVGKEDNILLFLAMKRADIMIDAVVPTNYLIKEMELSQKIVLTKSRFSQVDFHLLLSRKSQYVSWMDRIDSAFEKAEKSGRIQNIISGYESPERE